METLDSKLRDRLTLIRTTITSLQALPQDDSVTKAINNLSDYRESIIRLFSSEGLEV